ncbi:hypothetical protein PENANT_c040G02023 [Penicillium antarcticum]|uniref:AB hydrolase-1 domain-containing protein n=1 Tax=Penicillium antarcticum TaxID=416450 RepID=A0A1V6PSQ2_9EURO|nr:hypothetical protein PENANT_c040G02023 [Penicillium antarcticum]
MASLAFPSMAKKATLSDGTLYGYVAHPSSRAGGITSLLLHGYPSSCYDWRHQIKRLSAAGYGVIAPDLLGYGDTDKPTDQTSYRLNSMSYHMAEILDIENVERCVALGHDWGCGLLSRLVTYIPDRLVGIVPTSVGYIQPGMDWDIDVFNAHTEDLFGYPTYGYWPWHNTDDAVGDCDEHPASVFTLIYAANPEDWKINLAPRGAAAQDRILAQGYRGPMNWYKAAMRGVNRIDEAEVPEADRRCHLPTLLIVGEKDYVTKADVNIAVTKRWAHDLRVENFDSGYWVQLERPDELHRVLEDFALELTSRLSS